MEFPINVGTLGICSRLYPCFAEAIEGERRRHLPQPRQRFSLFLPGLIQLGSGSKTMVKESKFFRKQAERAERIALATSDDEASQSLLNLANAYRGQADVLKQRNKLKKSEKKIERNVFKK
jgi:hypothetical protein